MKQTDIKKKQAHSRLTFIIVDVPYRKPGNVIAHLPVRFIVKRNRVFKVFCLCDGATRRLTNVPQFFEFSLVNHKIIASENFMELVLAIWNSLPKKDLPSSLKQYDEMRRSS